MHKIIRWKLAGMVKDGVKHWDVKFNIMELPSARKYHSTMTVHRGRHLNIHNKILDEKMTEIVKKGQIDGWLAPQYKAKLENLIAQEMDALRQGNTILNRADVIETVLTEHMELVNKMPKNKVNAALNKVMREAKTGLLSKDDYKMKLLKLLEITPKQ